MQYIEVRLEGEGGAMIKKMDGNFAEIINGLPVDDESNFPWLRGIDPYGLTVFNLYQVPHLVKELNELAAQNKNLTPQINGTTEFLKQIEQHAYIKFIGD